MTSNFIHDLFLSPVLQYKSLQSIQAWLEHRRAGILKVLWAKTAGVWKQNSPVRLCPNSTGRDSGCHSDKFLQLVDKSAFWAISWRKWLAKPHAVVDLRLAKIFSMYLYDVWCGRAYSLIIISSSGSPMFTWLSSFWKKPTQRVMS